MNVQIIKNTFPLKRQRLYLKPEIEPSILFLTNVSNLFVVKVLFVNLLTGGK